MLISIIYNARNCVNYMWLDKNYKSADYKEIFSYTDNDLNIFH